MDFGALVPEVLLAASAVGGFAFARRHGGGTALEELERANSVLERRVHELETSDAAKSMRIAELEAKTDVALAITPVLEALRMHELEAAKRSNATLLLLELIAARLGPEPAAT